MKKLVAKTVQELEAALCQFQAGSLVRAYEDGEDRVLVVETAPGEEDLGEIRTA